MARLTTVRLVDDVDGSDADETITFALDTVAYEIDLSEVHAKELRSVIAPYIEAGRKTAVKVGMFRTRIPAASRAAQKHDNRAIREWARSNGVEIAERGRIPADVVARYEAA